MKKRILALLMALAMALSLAACGSNEPGASNSASPDPSDSPSASADLSQDILTFAAGELAAKDDLLTVNGEAVSTNLLLYRLAFSCSYFESSYSYYGLTVADYADSIRADNNTMAAYYTILAQQADRNGCPLTDEQQQAIAATLYADADTLEQRRALYGLADEDMEFLYSVEGLYSNLMDALIPVPTEDDLNSYIYQARHILLLTVDMNGTPTVNDEGAYVYPALDDETIAEKRALAEDLLAQLQAADDLDAKFNELMNEYSEDTGLSSNPNGYTTTVGKMVAPFEEAALSLDFGGLSGIVESSYGYHIILRGEVEELGSYADAYRQNKMDTLADEWLSTADIQVSDALAELDVNDFYQRYLAWQEAYLETLNLDAQE